MEKWLKIGLLAFCLASAASASLRARYCIPGNHYYVRIADTAKVNELAALVADTTYGDTSIYSPNDNVDWMVIGKTAAEVTYGDTIYERHVHGSYKKNVWVWHEDNDFFDSGVWDGYDEENGFDEAVDPMGAAPTVPAGVFLGDLSPVSDAIWIDSVAEQGKFPFLGPNIDAELASNANIVVLYGQLSVPEDGEYTFVTCARYQTLKFWIDIDGDNVFSDDKDSIGIDIDTTLDSLGNTVYDTTTLYTGTESNLWSSVDRASIVPELLPEKLSGSKTAVWSVNLTQGKYKVRIFQWGWGAGGQSVALGWKKPSATAAEIIPASAFGERKQFGIPYITMPAMLQDGAETAAINELVSCDGTQPVDTITVGWVAQIENTEHYAGATYKYAWIIELPDGTNDTVEHVSTATTDTVSKDMLIAGLYRPSLSVSVEHEGETLLLRLFDYGDSDVELSAQLACEPIVGIVDPGAKGRPALRVAGGRLIVNTAKDDPVSVRLYSADGRVAFKRDLAGARMLDMAKVQLPAGLYIARIHYRGALMNSMPIMVR